MNKGTVYACLQQINYNSFFKLLITLTALEQIEMCHAISMTDY